MPEKLGWHKHQRDPIARNEAAPRGERQSDAVGRVVEEETFPFGIGGVE